MPPQLAAVLTWGFIFWLFRRDVRQRPNITHALWIPFFWLVINMSQPISMWLQMFGVPVSGSLEGGTPVDAVSYGGLLVAGIYVLNRRRVTLGGVIRNNVWLTMFLVYGLISIAWSDFPFIASKRWIKVLGHPIMALIVITEPDPKEALVRLLKRLAYVLVPLSVLFIKYYPEWGRGFSQWGGSGINSGVARNKNALGTDCLIFTFLFIWHCLQIRRWKPGWRKHEELFLCLFFLGLVFWLFKLSDSKTPLVSLSVGLAMMIFAGLRSVNPRWTTVYFIAAIVLGISVEWMVGILDNLLHLLGRDASLTDRTEVWADLLRIEINPILGTGFESFWLGERLDTMWAMWWWRPTQAHNGYLETYLNLGLIGLSILVGTILVTWRKCQRALLHSRELGRFWLGFLVTVVLYNWTEASFKAIHPMWTMFYLIAMEYPRNVANRLAARETSRREQTEDNSWENREEPIPI
jgi:O-antigen ligase